MEVIPTLSERVDEYLRTAPRSRDWFNRRTGRWEKGWLCINKNALFTIFMEHRRARAQQAMAELDAEIAAEEAAEKRRLKRKACAKSKRPHTTR